MKWITREHIKDLLAPEQGRLALIVRAADTTGQAQVASEGSRLRAIAQGPASIIPLGLARHHGRRDARVRTLGEFGATLVMA